MEPPRAPARPSPGSSPSEPRVPSPKLPSEARPERPWRGRLHEIIFEAETTAGRAFDLTLLVAITLSVAVVLLESVRAVRETHGALLYVAEWVLTGLFTVEYVLRLVAVRRPLAYARSFFGVIDLLAILPTWLSLVLPGAQALLVVRAFRLLRVFRILKLGAFLVESRVLVAALRASRRKITVFLGFVLVSVLLIGSLAYLIEGEENGFTSIPISVYWAVVTLTTVGYGDLAPKTPLGQLLASAVMILGYAIIAVPTGIVTSELVRGGRPERPTTQCCPHCAEYGHQEDARYCRLCGHPL
jgi:voltage-gated potassium channel